MSTFPGFEDQYDSIADKNYAGVGPHAYSEVGKEYEVCMCVFWAIYMAVVDI